MGSFERKSNFLKGFNLQLFFFGVIFGHSRLLFLFLGGGMFFHGYDPQKTSDFLGDHALLQTCSFVTKKHRRETCAVPPSNNKFSHTSREVLKAKILPFLGEDFRNLCHGGG